MDLNPTHMPPNPPDPVGPPAPARPVVKRKRTGGNIGAFKMLPSISNLSSPASRSTPSAAHSSQGIPQGSTIPCPPPSASSAPSAPSTARSGDHPHQAVQSEPPQHPASFAKPPTSATTSPAAFFHNTGKPKVPHLANRKDLFGLPLLINSQATAPPPISTTSRSSDEEDSQPARFPPSALETHDRQSSMESTTATHSVARFVVNTLDDPDPDSDSTWSPMTSPIARESPFPPALLGASQPNHQGPAPNEKGPAFTSASALDDTPYKTCIGKYLFFSFTTKQCHSI